MIDLTKLEKLIEDGYIKKRKHPQYDIWIYNYSQLCQFEEHWNDLTKTCRGLVLDAQGNVLARPFPKFFNIEQHKTLPIEPFDVFEKVDGSLGIIFWYEPAQEWIFASRGSFESEQAIEFKKMFETQYKRDLKWFDKEYTYLFEIIYPSNRIVVDYGDTSEAVFLTRINTKTGKEVGPRGDFFTRMENGKLCRAQAAFVECSSRLPTFRAAEVYHFDSIEDLKKSTLDNSEGYVVVFDSGLRVKMKFAEYVRLHKLITEASTKTIWECLKDGKSLEDLLEKVPDEFYTWVKTTRLELLENYTKLDQEVQTWYKNVMRQKFKTRKDQANYILNSCPKNLSSMLFLALDERDYSHIIWDRIRPEYARPFWNDSEEKNDN